MTNNRLMVIRYIVSDEEPRPGRVDYWNGVFLPGKTPLNRACLETSKVFFIIVLSIFIMMITTWF
ncbi:MAG: hypothetical protein ACQ9MH_18240 [Nitrospinales bacterium]